MRKLENFLMPLPKEINQSDKNFLVAKFGKSVKIEADDSIALISEGKKLIEKEIFKLGCIVNCFESSYKIILKVDAEDNIFSDVEEDEAYYIKTDENSTILCGRDFPGVFYAAVTFCDMIYMDGDNLLLPDAFIKDYPDFKYRGHFMECRYGSEFMTRKDWYEAIDYLAKTKVNRLMIGVYGCWSRQYDGKWAEYLYIPLEKYPDIKSYKNKKYYSVLNGEWVYEENLLPVMYEEDYLGDLIDYGKRKNILVRPLFNSLGHNTLLPKCLPEIAAKDENGNSKGFGFCTKNEKTYEVMFSIYDNIIDKYLLPRGIDEIEIGLDEVMDFYKCHCSECSKFTHAELMVEYIIKLCKYLKCRGMKRIYVYHDMLYHEFNIVNEELKERFIKEDIFDEVVLDWWTYEDPLHLFWNKADGVNNIFHSVIKPDTGYYNWLIPTENNENIRACAKMATDLGFEGIEAYGSFDPCFDKNYRTLAEVAWNKHSAENEEEFNKRYASRFYPADCTAAYTAFHALSDIMKDDSRNHYMNRLSRFFEYYNYCYCREGLPYPQHYPEEVYKRIESDEKVYIPYMEFIKEKALTALSFFENAKSCGRENDMWILTARQYFTDGDEFLTLYGLWKDYNEDRVSGTYVLSELCRLVSQREKLMAFAEKVKMKATSYTYLRNMSILLEILKCMRDYFEKEIKKGNKPLFNLKDLKEILDDKVNFLR